ncbi:aldose epimerase family protein [Planctomycetota bacterium]
MNIQKQGFGKTQSGKAVDLYTLTNVNGSQVKITNFGGIIVSLSVPDRNGKSGDVVLGHDTLEPYFENSPYFGAIVGRYCNRIAKGRFKLNGTAYTLATNNNENHLHGGNIGFNKVIWDAQEIRKSDSVGLELYYISKDGEEGYPGNLSVSVKYLWTNDNELRIEYFAVTDKPTVVNLTHHSYFNLVCKGDILNHVLKIYADRIIAVDQSLIPTGEMAKISGTPFDFTEPVAIGSRITQDNEQLKLGRGYDHTWVLNDSKDTLKPAASLYDPKSGRFMEVFTTEPGVQFYSGNFLDGTIAGKNGTVYNERSGLCLETQHFPDSPNQPEFPSTTLRASEEYFTTTVYKFLTK